MGRPLAQAPGELRGFEERARAMLDFAPDALRDWQPPERSGFQRWIQREPLGTVLVLAPWNYPYLTAVNTLIPALAAGNSVLLKHSDQVPLCAERLERTARAAGLPEGVLQVLHAHHDDVARMVADPRVHFVAFTGSNEGGAAVARAAAAGMAGLSLELGGKDAAYVAEDADLARAAESLVDGAFFNSGQSCCGIERVYVHQRHFEVFLHDFLKQTRAYRLGDPRQPETNLGPMARARNAEQVRAQLEEVERSGAQLHIDPQPFGAEALGPAYLAPQVVTGVAPEARLMREETFGPVVVIQPVGSDEEALRCMEDSAYGLTASIWTQDPARARSLGAQLTVGTVFMNRCDYLDPSLAWVGVRHPDGLQPLSSRLPGPDPTEILSLPPDLKGSS